jgi:SET family sugar efflux transporter-like MFS transporter
MKNRIIFRIPLYSNIFIKAAVLLFICSSSSAICTPFMSVFLLQKVKASLSQIGFFITLGSFAALLISTLIAYISDKFNKRKLLLYFILISAIAGYLLYSLIQDYFILLLVAISFIGISSTTTSQIFAYTKELFDNNNMPESSIIILRTCMSVAWVSSPLIGAFINQNYGFSGLFIGTTIGYFLGLLCLFLFFRKSCLLKPENNNLTNLKEKDCKIKQYSTKIIMIYFFIFTSLQLINAVLNTNLPLYITETLGYKISYIGIIASFSAFIEIPIMLLFGSLSKKIDTSNLIAIGIFCGLIFLIFLSIVRNIYLIIILHILKSIFISAYMGIGILFFQNMIPRRYGISTTLFMNTNRVGTMCSGVITSFIGIHYSKTFIILICICICSLLVFIFTQYKGKKIYLWKKK